MIVNTQLTLGEELRDEAISQVESAMDRQWKHIALAAVRVLAERGDPFTTDDVWAKVEGLSLATTHEPRAMGAVMQRAAKLGLIKATDRTVQSRRPRCHARPVRVWMPL